MASLNDIGDHPGSSSLWFSPAASQKLEGREKQIFAASVSNQVEEYELTSFEGAPITKECLEVFGDPELMSGVCDLIATGSHICSLTASTAAEFTPYLNIISAPLYLYHAFKEAKERFGLMHAAFKTSEIADMFFWGGGAIGAVGSALSDIIKPLAGGITLFGLSQLPALAVTFNFAIPIALIILSTIGGVTQGWSMARTQKVLHQYKQKKGELKTLSSLKKYLQGPQPEGLSAERYKLDEKHFKGNHFTSDARQKMVLNRTLDLSNQLLVMIQGLKTVGPELADRSRDLEQERDGLDALKKQIYHEGQEIVDTVHSEIHRKLSEQMLIILGAIITLIAGILFIAFPHHATTGYALSLAASTLGVFGVIYSKGCSQERFLQIERALKILPHPT